MKLNDFANQVLSFIRITPEAGIPDILNAGIGKSEPEIEFVIYQLKMFGYL
ncbi:hypothetical protein [Providencia alcalifaciens]|uniref:hypothetical protein n=1 Tax=Providencia alcalifaciens TaxID=126385 RepID=UPI002B055B05|nr:hypothetical protein [Providencia alcalifaciens]